MGFEVVAKSTRRGPEAAGPVRVRGIGAIIIASEVATQVGMTVGDHVRLLAGNGPDFGRWAIEKANDGYALSGNGKRSKDLVVTCRAVGKAINSPRLPVTAVEYEIVGKRLIITLPKQSSLQAAE